MNEAARRLFPAAAGEERTVALMLLHSFFMGASTVFFETAASALFLARFGSGALPWVYIAAALLNTAAGAAYARIQARVPFARLMTGTLWFLFLTVGLMRAGLAVSGAGAVVFALLVWYRVLSILTDLEYWAVAARLYDVRQAKRLFGFIGSGEVIARIAGAFAVPLVVRGTGVPNLVLLSAAALFACLVLASLVLRAAPGGRDTGPAVREAARERSGPRALLGHRYLRVVVTLAFFGVMAKYLVDFAFLEQMRSRYGDARHLATFFALFSGTSQVVSLLTRLFVSGPLLGRYGIRVGLLVLPLMHALCTTAIVVLGLAPAPAGAVFWLVITNQGIYKTLKHPIDNPSFKVLYQPLRREERLATQVLVETLVTPITIGLAGGLMLLFSHVVPFDPVVFSLVMLATFAAWAWFSVRAAGEYTRALLEALRLRTVDDEPFRYADAPSRRALEKALTSGAPADVLFALDLMEKAGVAGLVPVLTRLVDHPSAEVRRSALLRLARLQPAGVADRVAARAAAEGDPRVRAAALRCLCAVGGPGARPQVASALEDPDPEIRRGAMIGLLRADDEAAFRHLVFLAGESRAADRAWAARVIGEVGRKGFHAPLRWLLKDIEPEVRRAALAAAGRVRADELWPLAAQNLGKASYRVAAAQALASGGESALGALEGVLTSCDDARARRAAAETCGRIGGRAATALLSRHIGADDEAVRLAVLRALDVAGWRAEGDDAARVRDGLVGEVREAGWTLRRLRDLADDPRLGLVRRALAGEVERNGEAALLLLTFLHDPIVLHRVRRGLRHPSREKRAYALEILDVTLDPDLRDLVLPLVDDLTVGERCLRLGLAEDGAAGVEAILLELMGAPARAVAPVTRAAALHALTLVREGPVAEAAPLARSDPSALVRETARWAARGPRPATHDGGPPMLTIEKVIRLKTVPMFAQASEEILADVAGILEEVAVPAGGVVFEKGAAGEGMYIVHSGRVRVYDGARTITHLGEKEIFGELALLSPEPRFASVAAVEDTRLFRLDREAFAELMAGNIEIVRGVLSVLCDRIRQQTAAGA